MTAASSLTDYFNDPERWEEVLFVGGVVTVNGDDGRVAPEPTSEAELTTIVTRLLAATDIGTSDG
jgi:hypothetical protein